MILITAILCTGCAVVRDPITDKVIFAGGMWGTIDYCHEVHVYVGELQVGTETESLQREISATETLGQIASVVSAAAALAILFL